MYLPLTQIVQARHKQVDMLTAGLETASSYSVQILGL